MLPAFFVMLERMVTIMKRFYTAESVMEGHPDSQIAFRLVVIEWHTEILYK